mmetsp:Transcript_20161/g.19474  ORF Transcript_20161/g.19474 Transcript_20161/m.19474 type:complete len:315 (-) Transcript_20161:125-1069(-)|eukprot:CAMPEP_0119048976 /NCGR_PEP_ID=MMETSP1177-20130426/62064_1 /TAXON_ID=2985 /ORGANISM="Ochromonas sp, Strain CCMP1899" /LENGTH=314 /DNA_ID=CAMNT_0007025597 /DNA_START=31 /DNA_END=975 /DNA_ORIENTATION=+
MENDSWEKCARTLSLNTESDLIKLCDLLQTLCKNVILNPSEKKYRIVKLSNKGIQDRLVNRKGGLEFLNAVGFQTKVLDGSKVLELVVDIDDEISYIYQMEESLVWLASTVETCVKMSEIYKRQPNESCAECVIHLKLPTGTSVYGGFSRTEPVSTVLSFACCFFNPDRATSVMLRQAHNATAVVTGEELGMDLSQLGLCPRATLIVSVLSDEKRSDTMQQSQKKVACDIKDQKEKAEKIRLQKLLEREAIQREKEKALIAYKTDRDAVKDRVAYSGRVQQNTDLDNPANMGKTSIQSEDILQIDNVEEVKKNM